MARPKKQTVDYFPHYCIQGKTLFVVEKNFGNNGYAVLFKTLEALGKTEGHLLDLNNEAEYEFYSAQMGVSGEETRLIIDLLSKLDFIDKKMWSKNKIWCQNFVDNLKTVYDKRRVECPEKPITEAETLVTETETELKPAVIRKENKIKQNKTKEYIASEETSPQAVKEFNYQEKLESWINGKNRAYSLIGKYFRNKALVFDTEEKMRIASKRHLRSAQDLSKFSVEEINEALEKIPKDIRKEYTLETILKYLSK